MDEIDREIRRAQAMARDIRLTLQASVIASEGQKRLFVPRTPLKSLALLECAEGLQRLVDRLKSSPERDAAQRDATLLLEGSSALHAIMMRERIKENSSE